MREVDEGFGGGSGKLGRLAEEACERRKEAVGAGGKGTEAIFGAGEVADDVDGRLFDLTMSDKEKVRVRVLEEIE